MICWWLVSWWWLGFYGCWLGCLLWLWCVVFFCCLKLLERWWLVWVWLVDILRLCVVCWYWCDWWICGCSWCSLIGGRYFFWLVLCGCWFSWLYIFCGFVVVCVWCYVVVWSGGLIVVYILVWLVYFWVVWWFWCCWCSVWSGLDGRMVFWWLFVWWWECCGCWIWWSGCWILVFYIFCLGGIVVCSL